MKKGWPLVCAFVSIVGSACGGGGETGPEILNPERDEYRTWLMVEPEGAVCGNGSQYRFFVNFSDTSDNLTVVFEPGGACWDFDSCTGRNGIRGAANPDGISEDHFHLGQAISPFLNRFDPDSPTADWNMVYVPYCTGDVHTGNNVMEYVDETGVESPIMFHHKGHDATQAVIAWIDDNFTHVPKMLATGCSAGGAGSITNYWFLRNGIAAVEQSYLLDDSGPIFPSTGFSGPLHTKIRDSWNVDSILTDLPAEFDPEDFGTLNSALADAFPDDRLATTYFRRDMNYFLYSYERFYEPTPEKEEILSMWDSDTQLLVDLYDAKPNLHYYLPYWRDLNDSHCTTLFSFPGSEIEDHGLDLATWVNDLIADEPLENAMEAPVPGEDE
jgi:hypothetical protein